MAVVTYTVNVTGSSATIVPDPTTMMQTERDFMIFQRATGMTRDIKIKVVGGTINGQIIVAVRGASSRIQVNQPTLDADGSVLITVTDSAASGAGPDGGGVGGVTASAAPASGGIGFPP